MSVLTPVIAAVSDSASGRVVVGFNWTAVEASSRKGSRLGLASTPSKADGARTVPATGSFGGRPLLELAALAGSENPYERAIGLAACNAHWSEQIELPQTATSDGLAAESGERVVVIGRFPGLDQKLPGALVLEKHPGPNDIPAEQAPEVVPTADRLIVTATTMVNGSIDGLLALVSPGCKVTLVGPGTPLCPALLEHGFDRLAGFLVTDTEACLKAVMEGAGARAFRQFGRQIVLKRA